MNEKKKKERKTKILSTYRTNTEEKVGRERERLTWLGRTGL